MLVFAVLLALSLVTVIASAVASELQARELERTALGHPSNAPAADPFDEIVAGLLADDPSFGRRAA